MQYFFLSTSLPEIEVGSPMGMHFAELMQLYELNLIRKDLEKVQRIRLLVDLKNVQEYLIEGVFDPRGNLSLKEIEDALLNRVNLPEYLFDFFEETQESKDRFRRFSRVLAQFFAEQMQINRGFLKKFFTFEREVRLLLLAYRAKRLGRDIQVELKYEDPTDPFVSYLIASKDMPQLEMPFEYADLQEVLIKTEDEPARQFQELMQYKIIKIQEMAMYQPFSIDWLLAYMVILMYVEDWYGLNKEQGHNALNKIIKEVA
jgi:hypothetical protein